MSQLSPSEQHISELLTNDSVYSKNIMAVKVNALKATFPVTAELLGESYFNQCANTYISTISMRTQDLNLFGDNFHQIMASLVDEQQELREHDYLPELVLFEWMLHQAHYLGDSDTIFRMIAQYNVKDIWDAHHAEDIDEALSNFTLLKGEYRYQFN